jgi:hypothetical protein
VEWRSLVSKMSKMTKEQAIEIIKQVCASFVGNLGQHNQIQEALKVIEGE